MKRLAALVGCVTLSGSVACRTATPPLRDERCGTAQPLPLCTPEQLQGTLTLDEFFRTAPRERTRVRGRLVFGAAMPGGECNAAELRLALGSGRGGEVVSRTGPLILLTESSPWRAPRVRAFEDHANAFGCSSREKGFCCAHHVAGQEVIATGFVVPPPAIDATQPTTDFGTWWHRTETGGSARDSCVSAAARKPYTLPWRGRPDAVAGLSVTDLCELPE